MAKYEHEWRDGDSTYKVGRIEQTDGSEGDEAANAAAAEAADGPNQFTNYGNTITYDDRGNVVVSGGPGMDQVDRVTVVRNGEIDWTQSTPPDMGEGLAPGGVHPDGGGSPLDAPGGASAELSPYEQPSQPDQTPGPAAVRFTPEAYGNNILRAPDGPTGAYYDAPPRSRVKIGEVAVSMDEATAVPPQGYERARQPSPAALEALGSAGLEAGYRQLDEPGPSGERRHGGAVFLIDGTAFTIFLDELNQTEEADKEGAVVMRALDQIRRDALKDAQQNQKDRSHLLDAGTTEFFQHLPQLAERVINSPYATAEQKRGFLGLLERSGGTSPKADSIAQLRALGVTEVPRPDDPEATANHPLLFMSKQARTPEELQRAWDGVFGPLMHLKGSERVAAQAEAARLTQDALTLANNAKRGLLPDMTAGNKPSRRNFQAYAKYDTLNGIIERLKAFLRS